MTKKCIKCRQDKSLDCFGARQGGKLRGRCKECRHEHEYAPNRERLVKKAVDRQTRKYQSVRSQVLRREYGLSLEQFNAILVSQGSACRMCGTDSPGGQGSFHVDHDHATGRVRGLLCHRCNTGLGLLGDNPLKAANMLARYAVITNAN